LRDYIRQWDTLLNDIRIVPIANLAQATEVLKVLSGDQSPLRLLLEAVERETTLDRVDADDEKDKSWVDKAGETLGTARSTLGKIIGRPRAGASPAQPRTTVSAVSEHFKALNQQVRSENGTPAPIDNTLALLNELYIFLDAGGDNPDLEHRKRIASVISKIQREAKRNPYPINHLMTAVANDSDSLVRGGARQQMNSMWRSTVLPFCQQAIQGRYPINRGSSRDITQEDFTQFFGPGGLMDTFYNDFLAASVDKSGRIWRWNSRDGSPAGISPNALRQFQRADAIKSIFFRMGRQTPSFNFTIKPIAMSADIYQFDLNVDGQKLRYAHGPQRPTPIKWPGPDNTGQVSIQLSPQVSGSASGLTQEGPWALFRLFDLAQITPTPNPVIFILKFNIQDREATFQLRAGSAVNPFLSKNLHNFACPRNL